MQQFQSLLSPFLYNIMHIIPFLTTQIFEKTSPHLLVHCTGTLSVGKLAVTLTASGSNQLTTIFLSRR